jgi:hypothetical protein
MENTFNPRFLLSTNFNEETSNERKENPMETLIPEIVEENSLMIPQRQAIVSPPVVYPEVIERPVYYFNNNEIRHVEGQRSLVNPKNGNVYSIVSDKYKVLPYKDSIEMIEESISKNSEFGRYEKNIEFLNEGGKMLAKFKFTDHSMEIQKGDFVNPEIILRRSYDAAWGFVLMFGAFRLICSNGLTIGEKILEYKHLHTKGINLQQISESLEGSLDRFSLQTKIWEKWVDRVTTSEDYERVMNTLDLGKNHTEAIENEIEISSDITLDDIRTKTLSYWVFFNLISQYITHKIVQRGINNNAIALQRQQTFYDRMRTAFRS